MDPNNNQGSPSFPRVWKYDVFISFRGPDTRDGFVDHLYNHLIRKGIFVFKDDERLEKGEFISSQLVQAIKGSRISLVVFSERYAGSKWCLDEMAMIAECKRELEQKVLPIFYHVDPSQVRHQTGVYGDAFDLHSDEFEENPGKVNRWSSAMKELANLAGWDIRSGEKEYGIIAGIVQKVIDELRHKFSGFADDLIGIQSRVEELEKLLKLSPEDDSHQVLGIWGMGGIGKTTHANVLYDKISYQFSACCFIEDVNQIYKTGGAVAVQKQILLQTLDEEKLDSRSPSEISGIIRNRLRKTKVLVVVDNVNDSEQFTELKIEPEFLGAGSRIIIITRDEHILKVCGACEVYSVPQLSNTEGHELFRSKAFKRFSPHNNCEELISDILEYAQGLPLAIKVIGSFFVDRVYTQWEDALKRLRSNHADNKIIGVLRLSYEGLENTEREIFLHIACFFNGDREDYVTRILDCCQLFPVVGIQRIIEKSLITIRNGEINMHRMLEELGKTIVGEHFSGKPASWSRLWLYEDFHYVMTSQTGTNNVEAIVLDQKVDVSKYGELNAGEFSRMVNLKLLILHLQKFSGNLNFLSNSLQYLTWHGYPFTSLPSNYEPSRLVELNMPNSNINRLWEGIKHLPNLKRMDLSNSRYLEETPNFEKMQNLERLDLTGCTNLVSVHPSISQLSLLVFLSLQNCCSLVSLDLFTYEESKFENKTSGLRKRVSLKFLRLSALEELGNMPGFNKRMKISSCGLVSLRVLHLSGCKKLVKTPDFTALSKLEYLDFDQCASLSTIDESIGHLKMLKYLSLRGCTNLDMIPRSINNLISLETLNLDGCLGLKDLPLASNVTPFSNLVGLIVLDLGFCNLTAIPDGVGRLRGLERLNLEGNKFTTLPGDMQYLFRLAYLNLAHCHELRELPDLPLQCASSGGRYFKTESGSRNNRSGLYIFDCPKLAYANDPNRACSELALRWLFRLVQAPRYFRCGFDIVVPGMVFSEWFNYQFEGDSIIRIVDFDAVFDNWIGFAFFASFEASPPPSVSVDMSSLLLSFETEQTEETFNMPHRWDLDTTRTSTHLWLIYISRPHCHFVKSGAHISFKAHPHLKITNWGLRILLQDSARQKYSDFLEKPGIAFNYVRENRGSSVPKVQLPYNWLVTDEEERENIEAKGKENNLSNVGLTTSHHQEHTASSSRLRISLRDG